MQLTINKLTLIKLHNRCDTLFLHTDLPAATWPFNEQDATIILRVASGLGEKYAADNFPGVPLTITTVMPGLVQTTTQT